MKKIAVVFLFFFFLSTGLLLFFVSQTKKTQDISSQANEERQFKLGIIIDDCKVMYTQTCPPPGGLMNTRVIHSVVDGILKESKNTRFATLKEQHLGADYPSLFSEIESGVQELSAADMLTRLTTRTNVNYLVLLTLMQVENNSFLSRDDLDPKHPLGGEADSAFAELIEASEALVINMESPPTQSVFNVGKTTYQFEPGINPGSISLYTYLASTSTSPEIFEKKVKDFPDAWQQLFKESAATANAFYTPVVFDEKPTPTIPGNYFPAPGDEELATSSGATVEELF